MTYVIATPEPTSVPVIGSDSRFPVRRIFCIGRNYSDHAKEMGSTVDRSNPVFFTKPADAVVTDGANAPYPPATANLHHEVEMVVALARGGTGIDPHHANTLIFGHAVGLDLTRRDLQAQAKDKGLPWDTAKAFDHSAPISAIRRVADGVPSGATELRLHVNGQLRQKTRLDAMIWSVPEIIAELSALFELKAGDLIFTGTPAGVSALQPGDTLLAELDELARLHTLIC
ncbi:fumarylacetoacetate hydrolase family protein [Oleiagrimonas sp.]|jgi:fumarylpyruvate hydrolase|uniref:fumarylacetoacetate hydrolase family protein n=1 Tax=Oleiagrimonas sp. TaxID=2010330 RepID=UPI0026356B71|nr:fumarylacetoacetate hydrolase family protein [Oleiagrimonas sp.]MDA3914715.1 fumarylacetoacetate hydrolase family protein [Oleiagrimonas sp.]